MSGVENHIIEAAVACIEKRGLQGATVRAIAEEAGVNVSAINYYFRSKEQLIDRVMDSTLDNAFDMSHFGPGEGATAVQRLTDILEHLTRGTQDYPEITRMHFYEPMILGRCPDKLGRRFSAFLQMLFDDLRGRGVALDDDALRGAILQAITAAVFGIGLLTPLFAPFTGDDYRDPQSRRRALNALARGVLGEGGAD